jgi:hypothetical protein
MKNWELIFVFVGPLYVVGVEGVDSVKWNYRLDGREAWIDGKMCEVSNIKWQIIVEAK